MIGRSTGRNRETVKSTARLFAEHHDFILMVIRDKCGCALDVEDVYQDVFLTLVRRPVPETVENVKGYLQRTIAIQANEAVRQRRRYHSVLERYAQNRGQRSAGQAPEAPVAVREEAQRALDLIEKGLLTKGESRAIELRYMHNWRPGDVAREMGVHVRSVSRYVSVGLKRMRLLLRAQEG